MRPGMFQDALSSTPRAAAFESGSSSNAFRVTLKVQESDGGTVSFVFCQRRASIPTISTFNPGLDRCWSGRPLGHVWFAQTRSAQMISVSAVDESCADRHQARECSRSSQIEEKLANTEQAHVDGTGAPQRADAPQNKQTVPSTAFLFRKTIKNS